MPSTVIVRLPNWLGDTVMAVPALRALRAGLPGARLALVGSWAALLKGQGLADILLAYPPPWRARLEVARRARALGADVALLLPNSFGAAVTGRAWGARRRVGFDADGRGWLLTERVALPSPRRHQIDEYLLLAGCLGAAPVVYEPCLEAPGPESAERRAVRRLLAETGVSGAPCVGVHLGAAFGPSKLWPEARVAELCRLLEADGTMPVLLGTREDAALAEAVLARAPARSLVGRDTPALLPALLAELDALVCGDTGVGHLAAALGTPVVALFGPTDPRLTAPRGRAAVVSHPTPCAPCFYRACPIDHPCMAGIAAAEVRERLGSLVQ